MRTVCAVEKMASDMELFCSARRILSQATGNWLQRAISWRSYTRFSLSRVRGAPFNVDLIFGVASGLELTICSFTSCLTTAM